MPIRTSQPLDARQRSRRVDPLRRSVIPGRYPLSSINLVSEQRYWRLAVLPPLYHLQSYAMTSDDAIDAKLEAFEAHLEDILRVVYPSCFPRRATTRRRFVHHELHQRRRYTRGPPAGANLSFVVPLSLPSGLYSFRLLLCSEITVPSLDRKENTRGHGRLWSVHKRGEGTAELCVVRYNW
ncbi:hypothetical protein BHM03_00017372 [Ensete ventricosum]|nr:hypothetical protein BHM03_00017372 [Ensete ventricosum]